MKIRTFIPESAFLRVFSTLGLLACLLQSCGEDDGGDDDPAPAVPAITSMNPTSGPEETEVTINGSNFSSSTTGNVVRFNGTQATVISAAPTELVVEVPAGATTGNVSITIGNETAQGPAFTVIAGNLYDCAYHDITESTTWEDVEPGVSITPLQNKKSQA